MKQLVSPGDITAAGLCIGCGSCVALEMVKGSEVRIIFDSYGNLKPSGPTRWFKEPTKEFSSICPFSPLSQNENDISKMLFPGQSSDEHTGASIVNYAGYVSEDEFRKQASSGGMTTWVAVELLRKGLIDGVAHVVASDNPTNDGKLFKYRISRKEEEIKQGAKSRYFPVDLSQVLAGILNNPGQYAIIGVPCFIKSVHLLKQNNPVLRERIRFTLGLFCGHMKSARFVESFAWQMKIPFGEIIGVDFRSKRPDKPANWYNFKFCLKDGSEQNRDWWRLADGDWGAGFFMNYACNYCDDVTGETADVSFGDAWIKPFSQEGMGNNVVVVRSKIIQELITTGINERRLNLETVSNEFVKETQAAGFRQRREGLSYRLTWQKRGIKLQKRVRPHLQITRERMKIYRIRYNISEHSHKIFRFSKITGARWLYILWARLTASAYYGIAYHNGSVRGMKQRFDVFRK